MDIYELYLAKNENTTIYLPQVKELFSSNQNKVYLSRIISKQIYVSDNNDRFVLLQQDINKEVDKYIHDGKLDKIEETADMVSNEITLQLKYYNSIFIKYYTSRKSNLNQYQFELDNNPYRQETNINGTKKLFKDFLASDYENMGTSNYQDTFTSNGNFNVKYNKVQYYKKALHSRNIDRSLAGNNMVRDSKQNIVYKKYNNKDLLENVSYLRKNNNTNINIENKSSS